MDSAIQNYASLYNTNVENYKNMSKEQLKTLMETLVPGWNGGIQQMMDKITGEGGLIPATQKAFEALD